MTSNKKKKMEKKAVITKNICDQNLHETLSILVNASFPSGLVKVHEVYYIRRWWSVGRSKSRSIMRWLSCSALWLLYKLPTNKGQYSTIKESKEQACNWTPVVVGTNGTKKYTSIQIFAYNLKPQSAATLVMPTSQWVHLG